MVQPEQEDPDSLKPPLNRDIEFDHVGYEHEENTPVLRDVNFTVKQGQTVAILGATGSGKSTLMNLLQRLYDVKKGEIRIGGVNLNRISKNYLALARGAGTARAVPLLPYGESQHRHRQAQPIVRHGALGGQDRRGRRLHQPL